MTKMPRFCSYLDACGLVANELYNLLISDIIETFQTPCISQVCNYGITLVSPSKYFSNTLFLCMEVFFTTASRRHWLVAPERRLPSAQTRHVMAVVRDAACALALAHRACPRQLDASLPQTFLPVHKRLRQERLGKKCVKVSSLHWCCFGTVVSCMGLLSVQRIVAAWNMSALLQWWRHTPLRRRSAQCECVEWRFRCDVTLKRLFSLQQTRGRRRLDSPHSFTAAASCCNYVAN